MTHAWLITGPPGSGRSNAARAFAAALQRPQAVVATAANAGPPSMGPTRTSTSSRRRVCRSRSVTRATWSRSPRFGRRSAGGGSSSSRTPTGSPNELPMRSSRPSRSRPLARSGCSARPASRTSSSRSARAPGTSDCGPHPSMRSPSSSSGATGSTRPWPCTQLARHSPTSGWPGAWPRTKAPGSVGGTSSRWRQDRRGRRRHRRRHRPGPDRRRGVSREHRQSATPPSGSPARDTGCRPDGAHAASPHPRPAGRAREGSRRPEPPGMRAT